MSGEWSSAQWVREQLGTDAHVALFAPLSRDELLALDRRALLARGLPVGASNTLSFAIAKLKQQSEAEAVARETRAREDKVNEKLAAAAAPTPEKRPKTDLPEPAAPAVAAPTTAVEPVASAAPQDDMADAESWDAERVRAYLEPIDAQAAALCVTHSIGGQRLFQLTTRELTELLGLVGMVPRRKVEHAIAKLREPVEALRARKLEEEARSLEGAVPMDRALVHKHLQNGLFVYVTRDDDARCIRFEAENKSHAPPQPLLVSIALTNRPTGDSVHKYFVVPDVQVRVDAPAGSAPVAPRQHKAERRELLAVRLVSNEDSFHWRVTYEVCTIELWLRWENEQKTALVQSSLQTPADASVPDIEYAMIKRGPGVKWVDSSFPPTDKSLYIDVDNVPPNMRVPVQWKRPEEFARAAPVLFAEISPNSVAQGRLGDCWFLAALSIIACHPPLVERLFETKQVQQYGVYACRFCRGGKWQRVLIDDFFPCTPSTGWIGFDLSSRAQLEEYLTGTGTHTTAGPVYSRTKDGSLWVCLLEKAYAKLNRSFQALTAGTLGESLYDLTGAPCLNLFFPWMTDDAKAGLFDKVLALHQSGQLMGCSTRSLKKKELASGYQLEKFGIVSRHAYSIIDVRRAQGLQMIRLRNPWGSFVWNGAFSDQSDRWTKAMRDACNFEVEQGQFWMEWKDFVQFFSEITVCKVGALADWAPPFHYDGVYSKEEQYGPQCTLSCAVDTPVIIFIAKEDLRFAQGADKDNSQGLYLMERRADGSFIMVETSGDMSRRELSIEATLRAGVTYQLVCLSFIGNLKFTRVPYRLSVFARQQVQVHMEAVFDAPLLGQAILCELEARLGERKRFTSEVYTLIHFCFTSSRAGVSNRLLVGAKGVELLMAAMRKYPTKQPLVQICCSCLWNLACSVELRPMMRESNVLELLKEAGNRFYNQPELAEVVDAAVRSITNAKAIAMDPVIEDCIIENACTFSVTGNKSFLLQVWFDCYTCNLRSNYGVCQSCAHICHAGHDLSAPKFSRFYCDCGGLPKDKRPPNVLPCKCVRTDMAKKREKDANYRDPDEDEPPAPNPKPAPRKKGGIATLFN